MAAILTGESIIMSDNDYLAVAGEEFGAEDEFGADDEFGAVARRRVIKPIGETMYGINSSGDVKKSASANCTAQPQRRTRLKKLSIDTTAAANFVIDSITVGVEPVLSTQGAIPAAVFSANSTAPVFKSVICDVGMTVTVGVTNIDAAADHPFYAAAIADELPYRR